MLNPENEKLLSLVSKSHQNALRLAIDFSENPSQETAEAVAQVMGELYEIKQNMKNRNAVIKRLDEVIKFAIRNNAEKEITKQFFDVKPPRRIGKIVNPVEMLSRLMKIFDDPMDFSSCVEFNFNHLKDLMGDDFVKANADIITETEYEAVVYLQNIQSKI